MGMIETLSQPGTVDTLILLLMAAVALLVVIRLYRAVKEEEEADEESERQASQAHATPRIPLRVVTEKDFEDARDSMHDDERLAVQRRHEGLSWLDNDEDFQRETA